MNDLLNYNTKPSSTEELFRVILKVVEKNYNEIVPLNVKERKNKDNAKMTDSEIITIYLLIECKGKSLNAGYSLLKNDFPNLVNYVERSRFNRLVNSLMTVIRAIRKNISSGIQDTFKIVDSLPLTVSKFGRAHFGKRFRDICGYGYCASKKEKYYGLKVHVVSNLDGNPCDFVITSANVDDRDVLYELSDLINIDTFLNG